MFQNIEFYNTPDGDVMIKAVNEPARRLKENDYEFISEMLTIISDRYPKAHAALMKLYSTRTMNKSILNTVLYTGSFGATSANMTSTIVILILMAILFSKRSNALFEESVH